MKFSQAQLNYMAARAMYDVTHKAYRDYELQIDAECEKLGLNTPYGVLPEGHPMMVEAQRLLDLDNAASKAMYSAARALFDWATETTLAKMGTPEQIKAIREMVASIKTKAYVEKPFIQLVDLSMRLAESA